MRIFCDSHYWYRSFSERAVLVKRKNGYICKTNFIYVSMKKMAFLLALVFPVSVGAAE